jgi:N4-gp56 family major capsid protein
MSDAYTTTGSISTDQAMWDRAMYYSLRPQMYFDRFADVKTTNATPEQGTSVKFTITTDLAVASTPLNESVDVDAVALSDSQVTLTPAEYGNAVVTTFRARATSFIPLDRTVANVVGFNAGVTLDTIARDIMAAGSNVRYATGGATDPTGRTSVEPGDTLSAHDVRRARTDLVGANVAPFEGGFYASVIHPDVAFDLRTETGAAAWRDPHVYSQPAEIWSGEVGAFEGFRFMESPRAPMFADAGSSTTLTDVYRTLFFGRQAIAKTYSTAEGRGAVPTTIFGPVTDKLRRFQPVGWHWYGAYGVFRQAALRAVESSSSIGAN